MNTILYINQNSVKHKISNDLFTYPYSSVHTIVNNDNLFIESSKVILLFNDKENFTLALQNYSV